MELMQINTLPYENFLETIGKLNLDMGHDDIKNLVRKSLFRWRVDKKDKSSKIGFYHHTIQDF